MNRKQRRAGKMRVPASPAMGNMVVPPAAAPNLQDMLAAASRYHQAGRLSEAEQLYRQILHTDPGHADALHLLGLLAHRAGRPEIAIDLIGQAIARNRRVPDFHGNLGNILQEQGRLNEAVASFETALTLKPDHAETHYNLGNALQALGRLDEAAASYRRTLTFKPEYAPAYNNLGNALRDLGKADAAADSFVQALALRPDYAEAHNNLGNALREQGKLAEAVASFERAVVLAPEIAEARSNLGNALQDQGRLDEAAACYEQALRLKPDYAQAEMNFCLTQLYRPDAGLPRILARARHWNEAHAAKFEPLWPAHSPPPQPAGQPRIGFISADFRCHPVGFLTIPAIEGLARAGYHLTCYSNSVRHDRLTSRFALATSAWRQVERLPDEALARLIQADGIDILVDLSGFTAGNRLLALARKPAPVQVSWAGYPASTGMKAIDYILADPFQIPPDAEPFYSEKVIRLPDCWVPFEPPGTMGAPGEPPCLSNGYVTFGSFNAVKKITPEVAAVWGRILNRLPGSRLLLKAGALNCPSTRQRYADLFAAQGIIAERLAFVGWTSLDEHRDWMRRADIALDTFPFSGGMTTLDTLWSGLPVITLAGETFCGRDSLGFLSAVGLSELVAANADHYADLATGLAEDLARLVALRSGLRPRMLASPLCDAERFSGHLASALTGMWKRWCDGLPAASFDVA